MQRLRYLDFELMIERVADRYTARVIRSPVGEASHTFTLPFSEEKLENLILKIARPRTTTRHIYSIELEAARELGGKLFETVLGHEIRACLRSSLNETSHQEDTGLRLKLRLQDVPELADLPWEFLFDSSLDRFFAQSIQTPIVRYIEMPERISPLTVTLPLQILVMISNPSDYASLDVEQEKSLLLKALGPLSAQGKVQVEWLEKATLPMLQRQLRRKVYHILHFIGHGGFDKKMEEGVLLLENEQGQGWFVASHRIGTLLHDHRALRLVILNSCEGSRNSRTDPFAGVASGLIRQGIPAVAAMQFEITDKAAITFASEFYSALVDGFPVDAAIAEARKAIYVLPNDVEWGTPVLYMRATDGVLFQMYSALLEKTELAGIESRQFLSDLIRFHNLLDLAFNFEELRNLCFEIGVDFDSLSGEGKNAKTRELVTYLNRRGRIKDLSLLCARERPHLSWPFAKANVYNTDQDETSITYPQVDPRNHPEQKEEKNGQLTEKLTSDLTGNQPRIVKQENDSPEQKKEYLQVRITAILILEGQTEGVKDVTFSPKGTVLASISARKKFIGFVNIVQIWDVSNGKLLGELKGTTGSVIHVAFSSDGTVLASISGISVWDIILAVTGRSIPKGTVQLWHFSSGKLLYTFENIDGVAFSPDQTTMALIEGSDVHIRRFSDGIPLHILQFNKRVMQVLFSPDGFILSATLQDGSIHLRHFLDGNPLYTFENLTESKKSVAFSPGGAIFAWGSYQTITLWSITDGGLLCILEEPEKDNTRLGIAFLDNGITLISGSANRPVRLWRISDGKLLHTFEWCRGHIDSFVFSPDKTLLARNIGNTVKIWRVSDGRLLHSLEGHTGEIRSVSFSPDGTILASGSSDKTVRLWRVETFTKTE